METETFTPGAEAALREYRQTLPQRLEVEAVVRAMSISPASELAALDVGMPNPAMSLLLRQRGGVWTSVARDAAAARAATAALGTPVAVLPPEGALGFEDRSFDWVVVALGVLTSMTDAEGFIHECHRVLKPTGQLILSTQRLKPFSMVNLVRRASGETAEQRGNIRLGYTEKELFGLLKTGFDVLAMQSYSRLFVEMVRIWELRARRAGAQARAGRAAPALYWVALQLDYLGLLARGHVLLAHCRRRQWKLRTAPILSDGRTIHEAVLSRTRRK
jgi:SAM-dependent methyltransferase